MDLRSRFLSSLRGWLLILLLFGLGNLVLVEAQKLWHHSDQVKLDGLKAELRVQHGEIEVLESQVKKCSAEGKMCEQLAVRYPDIISHRKRELSKLEGMRTRVRRLEAEVRSCSEAGNRQCDTRYTEYVGALKNYNAEVQSANAALPQLRLVQHEAEDCEQSVKECKETYAEYSSGIDSYNLKVDEANALSKKIGSIWYVVPVPRFAAHGRVEE